MLSEIYIKRRPFSHTHFPGTDTITFPFRLFHFLALFSLIIDNCYCITLTLHYLLYISKWGEAVTKAATEVVTTEVEMELVMELAPKLATSATSLDT